MAPRLQICPPSNEARPPADLEWGFAFGAGGAMGLAELGFVKAWQEEGLLTRRERADPDTPEKKKVAFGPFTVLTGSSFGAVAAGVLATDQTDEAIDVFCDMSLRQARQYLDFFRSKGGLIEGAEITQELRNRFGEVMIEDLGVGYCAMAMQIPDRPIRSLISANRKELFRKVPITKGKLWKATAASIRVPVVIAPMPHAEEDDAGDGGFAEVNVGDGGFVEMVPVQAAQELGAKWVFGVDVGKRGSLLHMGRRAVRDWHLREAKPYEMTSVVVPHGGGRFDRADEIIDAGYAQGRRGVGKMRAKIERCLEQRAR